MNKKTYFITGGGTGGHIYPAVAVADELLKSENTAKIYYEKRTTFSAVSY